jgi:hypothetical protein
MHEKQKKKARHVPGPRYVRSRLDRVRQCIEEMTNTEEISNGPSYVIMTLVLELSRAMNTLQAIPLRSKI